jgi:hypothetical protein
MLQHGESKNMLRKRGQAQKPQGPRFCLCIMVTQANLQKGVEEWLPGAGQGECSGNNCYWVQGLFPGDKNVLK